MNVLVVDDNASIALLIAATLRGLAAKIEIANTFSQALDWLGKIKFNLVIMDLDLPDSLPIQTIDRISELKQNGARVVVITGRWPATTLKTPVETGADAVIFKGDKDFMDRIKSIMAIKNPSPG